MGCLAFCEGEDESDLDCGEGYECVVPGEDQWAYMWRLEDPNVVCNPSTDGVDSTSVCSEGYECMTFTIGSYCGRPLKHCQEIRPVINSVEPSIGSVSGGTLVTIYGENFKPDSRVLISNMYASEVTWVSSTEMTVLAPSRSPGMGNVTVRSPTWQDGTLEMAFEFAVDTFDYELISGQWSARRWNSGCDSGREFPVQSDCNVWRGRRREYRRLQQHLSDGLADDSRAIAAGCGQR